MFRLIVVVPVPFQQFQNGDAAGGEQAVGADDDQHHGYEEEHQRFQRVLDGHSHQVTRAQRQDADEYQQPLGLWLTLAHLVAAQKFHGAGKVYQTNVVEQDEQEDRREDEKRDQRRLQGECQPKGHVEVQQLQQKQKHQFGERHAQSQTNDRAEQPHEQRLKEHHLRQMLFLHAQHVEQAELLAPPLGEEARGVKEEDDCEDGHHEAAQHQRRADGHLAARAREAGILREHVEDVGHGHGEHTGEDVGDIRPRVFADVVKRQPRVEELTHGRRPPCRQIRPAARGWKGRSWRRVCVDRTRVPPRRRGRVGGTPRRRAETALCPRGWRP